MYGLYFIFNSDSQSCPVLGLFGGGDYWNMDYWSPLSKLFPQWIRGCELDFPQFPSEAAGGVPSGNPPLRTTMLRKWQTGPFLVCSFISWHYFLSLMLYCLLPCPQPPVLFFPFSSSNLTKLTHIEFFTLDLVIHSQIYTSPLQH